MVPNLTAILQRLTGEWATLLQPDAMLALCRELEYTAWRDRVLTPVTTMQLFPHSTGFSGNVWSHVRLS